MTSKVNQPDSPDSQALSKLRWQCRRGMLELDLLLNSFLEVVFSGLTNNEKELFRQLLEYPDQTLYTWLLKNELTGQNSVVENVNLTPIIQKVRMHHICPETL